MSKSYWIKTTCRNGSITSVERKSDGVIFYVGQWEATHKAPIIAIEEGSQYKGGILLKTSPQGGICLDKAVHASIIYQTEDGVSVFEGSPVWILDTIQNTFKSSKASLLDRIDPYCKTFHRLNNLQSSLKTKYQ